MIKWQNWNQLNELNPKEYICGYCGKEIASKVGYFAQDPTISLSIFIYICGNCAKPTFFDLNNQQIPGPMLGRDVKKLPEDVNNVYKELRNCIKDRLYTAALLLGRKLIMHLAVGVAGSKEGEKFVKYIEDLKNAHFIPPGSGRLLEQVKDLGNEKNHELKIGTKKEAEEILRFIEMLLTFIYEFTDKDKNK